MAPQLIISQKIGEIQHKVSRENNFSSDNLKH